MRSLPDFEAWAVFASVAEAKSFSGAAAELGVSTATISKLVARLEVRLGGALLNRTSRRLSLTSFGEEVAERARRLVDDASRLEAVASDRILAPSGLVRIAAPMSFGQTELAPLLPVLLQRHPGLRIDLHLGDALVDLVGEGFDLALRITQLGASSLRARHIRDVSLRLVASAGLAGARTMPEHPNDLRHYPCFAYTYASSSDRWGFTHRDGETVSVPVSGPLRVNNGEAAIPWLLAGLGVGVLPDFMVQDPLARGALVELLPDWRLPRPSLSLVMPPSVLRPAAVTAAIAFLHERLAGQCPP
jgi:DNA-binding transcriptional LysR family regulator